MKKIPIIFCLLGILGWGIFFQNANAQSLINHTFRTCDSIHLYDLPWFTNFDETDYTGNYKYISLQFYSYDQATCKIDNLTLERIPTCTQPLYVNASNIHATSADISWTDMTEANQWSVEYGPTGFIPGDGSGNTIENITTKPYEIPNLSSATNYDFSVFSNCNSYSQSPHSPVLNATTDCSIMELPYNEDFESYASTNYDQEGIVPICWTSITRGENYPAPHITSTASEYCYPHSGTQALTFTMGTIGDDVNVSEADSTLCYVPNSITADNITNRTADLSWYVANNNNVNLQWRAEDGNWTSVNNIVGNSYQLNDLASGMYFIRLANDHAIATKKFIRK